MKSKFFMAVSLALVILVSLPVRAVTDKEEINAKINKIASYLDKPGGPGSDGTIMFTLLLESILQIAPETGFPPEFTENMVKVKDISDSTSILNPDGVVFLHKAYRIANSGNDFQMPESILEISDAVNYARMELGSARKQLKLGKMDICAKHLLETAVMIVTPMIK